MGALSLPRRENPFVFRRSGKADVLLLRLPRGRQRHHLCDEHRAHGIPRGGQAPGRARAHAHTGIAARRGHGAEKGSRPALCRAGRGRKILSQNPVYARRRAGAGIPPQPRHPRQRDPAFRPGRNGQGLVEPVYPSFRPGLCQAGAHRRKPRPGEGRQGV